MASEYATGTLMGIMGTLLILGLWGLALVDGPMRHDVGMDHEVCMVLNDERDGGKWTAERCIKGEDLLKLLAQRK